MTTKIISGAAANPAIFYRKVFFTAGLVLLAALARAQTAITSYTTVTAVPAAATNAANGWNTVNTCGSIGYFNNTNNYTSFFGQRYTGTGSPTNTSVTGFVVGGSTFKPVTASSSTPFTNINLQRVNNAVVTGNRFTGFFKYSSFRNPSTGTAATDVWNNDVDIYLEPGYINTMEALLNQLSLDYGTDNTFVNAPNAGACTGGATANNIERVDLVYTPGMGGTTAASLSKLGFLVNERGGNDKFKAAAITSVDGSGNVTGLGSLVTVATANWGQVGPSITSAIYMGTNSGTIQPKEYKGSQTISGVFISLSDLGIAVNTKIYGIAVFPDDITGNTLTLASAPTTTDDNTNTTVGLDMLSGNFFSREQNNFDVLAQALSGKVWDDANGDGLAAGENNVSGTNASAGGSVAAGGNLFINIVNSATNNIVAVVQVAADGTYAYNGMLPDFGYRLVLTATAGTVGSPVSSAAPSGWTNTKENLNGTIDAATPGVIAFTSPNLTNVVNYNFGIERTPDSDPKTAAITTPGHNAFVTLNGGSNPPFFTGSDPEDQPSSATLSTKSVSITSLPANGQLWYNGTQITAANTVISGFNPSMMQVKFTGGGYTTLSFNYAYVDAAGIADPTPATYTLNWPAAVPLPVKLVNFEANAAGCNAVLTWTTADERNLDYFAIQYSSDGSSYETVGRTNATNTHAGNTYSFTYSPAVAGKSYYRLQMTDNDGSYTYSNTVAATTSCDQQVITAYPNPTKGLVTITGLRDDEQVQVYDYTGRMLVSRQTTGNTAQVDISLFPAGLYHIVITNGGEKIFTNTIIKQE